MQDKSLPMALKGSIRRLKRICPHTLISLSTNTQSPSKQALMQARRPTLSISRASLFFLVGIFALRTINRPGWHSVSVHPYPYLMPLCALINRDLIPRRLKSALFDYSLIALKINLSFHNPTSTLLPGIACTPGVQDHTQSTLPGRYIRIEYCESKNL